MDRLTTKECVELLIKYNDGEYRSPCFGCESINKCNPEKVTCGFYKALEKLVEYEDLEEQGKLLKLPCTVGDKLFVINKNRNNLITEENVYDVQYRGEKYAKGQRFFMNIGALAYFEIDFGKTVFPTKEEAEAALKEL